MSSYIGGLAMWLVRRLVIVYKMIPTSYSPVTSFIVDHINSYGASIAILPAISRGSSGPTTITVQPADTATPCLPFSFY